MGYFRSMLLAVSNSSREALSVVRRDRDRDRDREREAQDQVAELSRAVEEAAEKLNQFADELKEAVNAASATLLPGPTRTHLLAMADNMDRAANGLSDHIVSTDPQMSSRFAGIGRRSASIVMGLTLALGATADTAQIYEVVSTNGRPVVEASDRVVVVADAMGSVSFPSDEAFELLVFLYRRDNNAYPWREIEPVMGVSTVADAREAAEDLKDWLERTGALVAFQVTSDGVVYRNPLRP